MAAEINFVKVSAAPHPSAVAAIASASSLREVAGSLPKGLSAQIDSLLMGGDDRGDLFWRESFDRAASGAGELEGFKVSPSDRHLELAAAVVREGHANATISHGWPILSVVARTSTVTGGGGESNLSPEGAA